MRAPFVRALRALKGRPTNLIRQREPRCAAIEPLESRQLLSTYYVSNSGSDSSSGQSSSAAWKTINRVNSQKLNPGDKVLFAGGQSFSGGLYLPSTEAGSGSNHVTFSTYGSGRATINSGSKPGLDAAQTAGVSVSNLNFKGSGMHANSSAGIFVHIDWSNRDLKGLNIKNVEVSGYGREGIRVLIGGSGSSLSDVKIEHAKVHDNLYAGLKISGSAHNSNKNYLIDHVEAYNNLGTRATSAVTGSGIYMADVENGVIRRSSAHDNGKDGRAPVGIWAAGSNRVTIEYCESYNNDTNNTTDGGGFDFDWDTHNSTMQYNYSHNNAGPGFIMAAGYHANSGNVIRYNVSENDGRKNGKAGMQLWGNVTDAQIYNNVVYMSATGNSKTAAFYAHDSGTKGLRPKNVQIRNNVFYTTGGAKLVNITSGVAGVSGGLLFAGNAYYSGGSTFKIQWGSSSYSSLSAWRTAKNQEKLSGVSTGYEGDPKFTAAGKGGTIGNADLLGSKLTAYRLASGSPLVNKGVTQPGFLSGVARDFYGDSLPKGGKVDIGIDEVA